MQLLIVFNNSKQSKCSNEGLIAYSIIKDCEVLHLNYRVH